MALWYTEMKRNLKRFKEVRKEIEVGKMSGAVGTFANIPPEIESYVCKHLGIDTAPVSTQTLQRDRHAETEVEEAFAKGQKDHQQCRINVIQSVQKILQVFQE